VLEGANIKLAAVATDILGRSGREVLEALVAGETDVVLAELARERPRDKQPALERALAGRFGPHQRLLVAHILAHIDFLDGTLQRLDTEIGERERPFEVVLERLDTIPSVARRVAEIIVAEVGPDVHRFPSPGHLASWAGLCPGQDKCAGKRRSGKTRKGNRSARTALVQAAHAARRTKTYLAAQFRRLAIRRGVKKAAVTVAHSILRIVYRLLTDEHPVRGSRRTVFRQPTERSGLAASRPAGLDGSRSVH
jgi:transposase